MNKIEFIKALTEYQGIKIPNPRMEKMAEPGGVMDIVQIIRAILFQAQVSGFKPQDDLQFKEEENQS